MRAALGIVDPSEQAGEPESGHRWGEVAADLAAVDLVPADLADDGLAAEGQRGAADAGQVAIDTDHIPHLHRLGRSAFALSRAAETASAS